MSPRKIRIGYISPDLCRHPVGFHLLPVMRCHDHERFQIVCYSDRQNEDDVSFEMKRLADVWRPVRHLDDQALAGQISSDSIDILVDLAGHTAFNRLRVFAMKPAPVQVSWLGYWGTTGLDSIDYVISDTHTILPETERYFSEKVRRLPGCRFCYAPPDYMPEVAPLPAAKNGYITFGSFNNIAKLNDDVISLWSCVLTSIPESRLVLKWQTLTDSTVRENLSSRFQSYGIHPERIEMRCLSTHKEMLAEYGDIDIALDPFPFSGGMTSCEALWMGVPVLTLPGDRPVSRQTLAYNRTIGLEGFEATNREEFVRLAQTWSADLPGLALIRSGLRGKMSASTVCDGEAFTVNLEAAFLEMADITGVSDLAKVTRETSGHRKVLNVGGNNKSIPIPKYYAGWVHHLLDIDPSGSPDIVADARELLGLEGSTYDAIYCSHNLEHYLLHHAVKVLRGFRHLLKPGGFLDIRVPDLGEVMRRVVSEGLDLDDVLYTTDQGLEIMVHDVLYGWGRRMAESGEEFYNHRCGFTESSLRRFLQENGFPYVTTRSGSLEVQAFAFASPPHESLLREIGVPSAGGIDAGVDSQALVDQALAAWEAGDQEKAVALCELILEDDEECVDAYLILGESSLQKNEIDDAVSYFRTALMFEAESLQGITGLVRSLELSGDIEEYQACLADVRTRFPEIVELLEK